MDSRPNILSIAMGVADVIMSWHLQEQLVEHGKRVGENTLCPKLGMEEMLMLVS